jgi:hypothetical protein
MGQDGSPHHAAPMPSPRDPIRIGAFPSLCRHWTIVGGNRAALVLIQPARRVARLDPAAPAADLLGLAADSPLREGTLDWFAADTAVDPAAKMVDGDEQNDGRQRNPAHHQNHVQIAHVHALSRVPQEGLAHVGPPTGWSGQYTGSAAAQPRVSTNGRGGGGRHRPERRRRFDFPCHPTFTSRPFPAMCRKASQCPDSFARRLGHRKSRSSKEEHPPRPRARAGRKEF